LGFKLACEAVPAESWNLLSYAVTCYRDVRDDTHWFQADPFYAFRACLQWEILRRCEH